MALWSVGMLDTHSLRWFHFDAFLNFLMMLKRSSRATVLSRVGTETRRVYLVNTSGIKEIDQVTVHSKSLDECWIVAS